MVPTSFFGLRILMNIHFFLLPLAKICHRRVERLAECLRLLQAASPPRRKRHLHYTCEQIWKRFFTRKGISNVLVFKHSPKVYWLYERGNIPIKKQKRDCLAVILSDLLTSNDHANFYLEHLNLSFSGLIHHYMVPLETRGLCYIVYSGD